MIKAIFLDRDGVLNDNARPVNKVTDLILYPWVSESLEVLSNLGYTLLVVTNQGGVSLGYLTEEELDKIHTELHTQTNNRIKEISYCPHIDNKNEYRKPNPGMINDFIKKYDIDPNQSFMIGDREADILAGYNAGVKTIKIGSPYYLADHNTNNLLEAAHLIKELSISNDKYSSK